MIVLKKDVIFLLIKVVNPEHVKLEENLKVLKTVTPQQKILLNRTKKERGKFFLYKETKKKIKNPLDLNDLGNFNFIRY